MYKKYLCAKNSVFIVTGPYFGYLLTVSYRMYHVVNDRYIIHRGDEHADKDGLRDIDIGTTLGIGYIKTLNQSFSVSLSAHYNQGVLNVNKSNDLVINSSFNLLCGIIYNLR